jgi:very-short-patch-repair endonuclease
LSLILKRHVNDQFLRELCESDFEREMFDELVKRGYRLRPQVKVGGYRIDLVVEGAEDRPLAVECDGDRWHGPGQRHDDMLRQRVLERAGWTFWRCFASSFVLKRRDVLSDLFGTLEGMEIEPLGSETVDSTQWTMRRDINPTTSEQNADEVETAECQLADAPATT